MSPLVELVNEWEAYNINAKKKSVEDFCQHYLAKKKRQAIPSVNSEESFNLARITGRIASMQRVYQKIALRQSGIELEWYYILHSVNRHKELRKTDLAGFHYLLEPSTGIDILNRMVQAGLLMEKTDPEDRRAKLLSISKEGKKMLDKADKLIRKACTHFYENLSRDETQFITRVFDKVEQAHHLLLTEHKHQPLDEIIRQSKAFK